MCLICWVFNVVLCTLCMCVSICDIRPPPNTHTYTYKQQTTNNKQTDKKTKPKTKPKRKTNKNKKQPTLAGVDAGEPGNAAKPSKPGEAGCDRPLHTPPPSPAGWLLGWVSGVWLGGTRLGVSEIHIAWSMVMEVGVRPPCVSPRSCMNDNTYGRGGCCCCERLVVVLLLL